MNITYRDIDYRHGYLHDVCKCGFRRARVLVGLRPPEGKPESARKRRKRRTQKTMADILTQKEW